MLPNPPYFGWCCLLYPPLGGVLLPSFFGKVLLSPPSTFGWLCSFHSSLDAAFLLLLGPKLHWGFATSSSFRFVCFPFYFRVCVLFSCHRSFSFPVLFLTSFHFLSVSFSFFIFHFIFSSYFHYRYYFHVSFSFSFLSGKGKRVWKRASLLPQKSRSQGGPICGISLVEFKIHIHAHCAKQRQCLEEKGSGTR